MITTVYLFLTAFILLISIIIVITITSIIKIHKIIRKMINGKHLDFYDIQTFNEWSYVNSFNLEQKINKEGENLYTIYKVIGGLFKIGSRKIYYYSSPDYKDAFKEYKKLTLKEIDNMITWKLYI